MELLYYPVMCETASYKISGQTPRNVPNLQNISRTSWAEGPLHLHLNRTELIAGNLILSISEFNVEEPVKITRMSMPVNDMYVFDFVLPERKYIRQFGDELFHSTKAYNHFGFSSATTQLSHICDAGCHLHHIEIYLSRSYLTKLLGELRPFEEKPWSFGLMNNDEIFQIQVLDIDQEKLLHDILDLFRADMASPKLLATHLAHQLVIGFFSKATVREPERQMIEKNDHQKIQEVKAMIESDMDRKIKLGEICHFCNMSQSKFKRLFKTITGKSYTDYYTMIRMDQAVRILRNGEISNLSELSVRLGYKSLSQFTRIFKNYYKSAPTYFLKTLK